MAVTKLNYKEYLASREWRLKRKEVIERYGDRCHRCLSRPISHVHHLTYERLGNERLDDLQGLCVPCHEFVSAERDKDPAIEAIWRCLKEHPLELEFIPVGAHGEDVPAWFRLGPTVMGEYFAAEFGTTPEDDPFLENVAIIPWPGAPGLWLRVWWM